MKSICLSIAATAFFALTACPNPPPATHCDGDGECPKGYNCIGNLCLVADAGPRDAAVGDRVGTDTLPAVCGDIVCEGNTHCVDVMDGGYQCQCGNSGICDPAQVCAQRTLSDGGHVEEYQCCPQGQEYCGTVCANTARNSSHCGGCFVQCGGATPSCVDRHCGCDPSADASGVCPTAANSTPYCQRADGGAYCAFTCDPNYGNCIDTEPGCETNLRTSAEHCGECERSAIQTRAYTTDAGPETLALTSVCVNGVPQCGAAPACDGGKVCFGTFFLDAGAPDGNERCVQCATARATNCPTGNICCNGACIGGSAAELDRHCGCRPNPLALDDGVNCQQFQLGSEDAGAPAGAICIDPADGGHVNRTTVYSGRCGCNANGAEQCGSALYDNDGKSTAVSLFGICLDNMCVPQSASSCGTSRVSCDPSIGGWLCEDHAPTETPDQAGECGCLSWTGANPNNGSLSCALPVNGHKIADLCSSNSGTCYCEGAGIGVVCGTSANPNPDCCPAGCTDLATNVESCGTCDTRCETSTLAGSDHEALCTYNSASRVAQCFCNGSPAGNADLAQCPTNGGGGGTYCDMGANACVCASNSNEACPIGTYCCGGNPINFQASGCCLQGCANLGAPNQCAQPGGCSGLKWTCTNGSAFWCCADGMKCGTGVGDCLVAP